MVVKEERFVYFPFAFGKNNGRAAGRDDFDVETSCPEQFSDKFRAFGLGLFFGRDGGYSTVTD